MTSPFEKARSQGYSDQEIVKFLGSNPQYSEKIKKAKQQGYSDEDVFGYLSQKKEPQQPPEQENDVERDIERNQASITSRMLERLFGLPGDVQSFASNLTRTPKLLPLPTSSDLRKVSEKLSGGYTKPKTSFEEKVGETAADVASFAMGNPSKTLLGTTARVVGIPILGAVAKETAESLGAKESTANAVKLGTMLITDLWGLKHGVMKGGAKEFGFKTLNEARDAIPKGAVADAAVLEKQLTRTQEALRKGVTGPHTSPALRAINQIKNHIKDGKIEADKFPRIREDINKIIEDMHGFKIGGPSKQIRSAAVKNLNEVKSSIIQAGNRWGRKNAPEFAQKWREGNEALAVYYRSKDYANFIKKHAKIKDPTLRLVLGLHSVSNPAKSIPLLAGKTVLEKGTQFPTALVYRFFKSKVLRNLYTDILKETAKGNGSAVAALSSKAEKEMKKEGIK